MSSFLSKKLSGRLAGIDMVEKENLDLVSQRSSYMYKLAVCPSFILHVVNFLLTPTVRSRVQRA